MGDSFDLRRFVDAQASIYPQVVEELSRGRKRSHWMWFVLPTWQAGAKVPKPTDPAGGRGVPDVAMASTRSQVRPA